MRTDTANKILDYIAERNEATAKEITRFLSISPQATHRQLKSLLTKTKIIKHGSAPKVFYTINELDRYYGSPLDTDQSGISYMIENKYMYISPSGKLLYGISGFIEWCRKQNLPVEKTAIEYEKTVQKYNTLKKNGLIDGMPKLKSTFPQIHLDELYYLDFYSIERFGKTKLGAQVLYAKLNQDRKLISQIASTIKPIIKKLISNKKISAIGYIPHSLPRKIQFLNELAENLRFDLPKINIVKIKNQIPVAQKTLNKLQDRVQNASETIFIDEDRAYKNVILLDDAVGSGASMNETAKKLKTKKIVRGKIIGLSLTGSYKGFDILNEV